MSDRLQENRKFRTKSWNKTTFKTLILEIFCCKLLIYTFCIYCTFARKGHFCYLNQYVRTLIGKRSLVQSTWYPKLLSNITGYSFGKILVNWILKKLYLTESLKYNFQSWCKASGQGLICPKMVLNSLGTCRTLVWSEKLRGGDIFKSIHKNVKIWPPAY